MKPFEKKIYLASPTMHGDEELSWVQEAYRTNWISTVGANINAVEKMLCERIGCKYAVGLGSGTSAIHMSLRLAAKRITKETGQLLKGQKVFLY